MAQQERVQWMNAVLLGGAYLHWQTVADKFEVNRRTVFNDMRFLRDQLRAPIAFSQRYKGWHYTAKNYQLPFLALSESESDTLRRTLLAALTYLPPADAAAAMQLALLLSPYVRGLPTYGGSLPASAEVFQAGQPILASHLTLSDALLTDMRRAIDTRCRLHLTYYSAHRDEITERVVQPYVLLNKGGELYLIGHCELRGALRDFGLHRIQARIVLEPAQAFTIPADFDVNAYLESAFQMRRGEPAVTVRAKFSPKQSRWQRERVVHPSQVITELDNGSVIVSLQVSGTAEVKKWLMSFGADVEIIEPEALRREMRTEAEKIISLHS